MKLVNKFYKRVRADEVGVTAKNFTAAPFLIKFEDRQWFKFDWYAPLIPRYLASREDPAGFDVLLVEL